MATWKVGELAKRTGVSVRTLHHYDEIGLLLPSHHTPSGHRLYRDGDVALLQQILSLKQLGFSLDEIRDCMGQADFSPLMVVRAHLGALRELIARQKEACDRLTWLATALEASAAEEVSADVFLDLVEAMTAVEQYYTPEQLAYLAERRKLFSDEQMQAAQQEWADLFARLKDAMERGVDPASDEVQAMAKRCEEKVLEFTGGDPGVMASLTKMYEQKPQMKETYAGGAAVWDYLDKARAAQKK